MWDLLTNRIDVFRRTASLLERVSAASTLAWDRQPNREAVVEFRIVADGTTGSGQVTIAGTSGGIASTETIASAGPGFFRSTLTWTALAGLTTSGLADEALVPSVEARAVGRDGSPIEGPYALVSGWPAAIMPGGAGGGISTGGSWPNDRRQGRTQEGLSTAIIAWDETWAPRVGDLVTDDTGKTWEIVGEPLVAGTVMDRHWSLRLARREPAP